MSDFIQVKIEDVLDWAFCPLRTWWKKGGGAATLEQEGKKTAGEQLVKDFVRTSLRAYYKQNPSSESFAQYVDIMDYAWDRMLEKWGLGQAKVLLVEYYTRRKAIMEMISKSTTPQVSEDGDRLVKPLKVYQWSESAASKGVLELRTEIDKIQTKAGLNPSFVSGEFSTPSIGLAEAFAISRTISENITDDLPPFDQIIGVGVPVSVELLSVNLTATADLVYREKEDDGLLVYEMHLFDGVAPSPQWFARDLRLMTLRQAYPEGRTSENATIKNVKVRILQTGLSQQFRGQDSIEVEILDALARAYVNGQRVGALVPRMVAGMESCGDCEFRSLCFTDTSDVMRDYNPPFREFIESSPKLLSEMRSLLKDQSSSENAKAIQILRSFIEWMNRSPALNAESASRMLDSLSAEFTDEVVS